MVSKTHLCVCVCVYGMHMCVLYVCIVRMCREQVGYTHRKKK